MQKNIDGGTKIEASRKVTVKGIGATVQLTAAISLFLCQRVRNGLD